MKSFLIPLSLCLLFLFSTCSKQLDAMGDKLDENRVQKTFVETNKVVANPSQGWMHFSQEQTPEPCTVNYIRLDWVELEKEEGVYNWNIIDEKLAKLSKGEKLGFRIKTCSAHSVGTYSTPKWVFDKGCKGYIYKTGGSVDHGGEVIERIEPDYSDPILLNYHEKFIKELGKRYNGSPKVSFVDIGSFGNWGEWHLTGFTDVPYPSDDILKRYVDMYVNAFPDTRLVFMTDERDILAYALKTYSNIGLRRDGVGSPIYAKQWAGSEEYKNCVGMGDVWKHSPVIFEWWGDYEYLEGRGWSFKDAVEWMLANHVSLVNDNIGKVPVKEQYLIEKLSKYAGARLVLRKMVYPKIVNKRTGKMNIELAISNVGVAPTYENYEQVFYLCNIYGEKVCSIYGKENPRSWIPGDYEFVESLELPQGLLSGNYKLGYALVDKDGNLPPFNLANELDIDNGAYIIGEIKIE